MLQSLKIIIIKNIYRSTIQFTLKQNVKHCKNVKHCRNVKNPRDSTDLKIKSLPEDAGGSDRVVLERSQVVETHDSVPST